MMSNVFLKVRAVYFKADSTISGAFQCSACLVGAPPACTSSTIDFLGVEGPFLNEVDPSRVVWRNCHLAGCAGAFSQLRKCFSKLLARLMALPQWEHLSFLMGGSQWCCLSAALLKKNLCSVLGSFYWTLHRLFDLLHVHRSSSWASVKILLQSIAVDLI